MEMLFVVGNRTRSCCQATALQRRASGCEHLCRGRSTAGAANPGCWGGHRPTEPGVPQLLPQGKGGDGAAPLPCLPQGPCPTRSPLHPRGLCGRFQLWFQPALLGGTCPCECLQSPWPSLSTYLRVLGGSIHPFCSRLSTPAHSPLSVLWHSLAAGLAQPG